jgi:hypothetical protein
MISDRGMTSSRRRLLADSAASEDAAPEDAAPEDAASEDDASEDDVAGPGSTGGAGTETADPSAGTGVVMPRP